MHPLPNLTAAVAAKLPPAVSPSLRDAALIGTLVAAGVLLIDIGDPTDVWSTFQHGSWSWLALAMVLSLASNIGFAMLVNA